MTLPFDRAPEWAVAQWLNVPTPSFGTADLAGRVVLAAGFQMLCPSCVEHTIPQLRRAAALFDPAQVAVVGIHTVFEHHEAMSPNALRAFLHEYRVTFPIAIDLPGPNGTPIPQTMARYDMQGTPTMLLIDRSWRLRRRTLGHLSDLQLAAEVVGLIHEPSTLDIVAPTGESLTGGPVGACDDAGCRVPS